jgi:hypothetical protein
MLNKCGKRRTADRIFEGKGKKAKGKNKNKVRPFTFCLPVERGNKGWAATASTDAAIDSMLG